MGRNLTMGRGKGGYTQIQTNYKDSGGRKVTDSGTIFVAERYIDMGFGPFIKNEIDETIEVFCGKTSQNSKDYDGETKNIENRNGKYPLIYSVLSYRGQFFIFYEIYDLFDQILELLNP